MKKFSVISLLIASLFLGCGDHSEVDEKSSSVVATTIDGSDYIFNGDIILQWDIDPYTYSDEDILSISEMFIEVDERDYPANWFWSRKIYNLRWVDIENQEVQVPFNFIIKLPFSNTNRSCKLKYKISLDTDSRYITRDCVLPRRK